ncbi:7802_t:CDS:2, partial [Funneliformis caledonium]
ITQIVGFATSRDSFEFPNEPDSAPMSSKVSWSTYFEDMNDDQWRLQAYRCKAYISSTFFCFVMTLTWIMSTSSLIIYFHTIKEEAANNNKEFEDNENV